MIKSFLIFAFDFFVPRFIDEWVMLVESESEYLPVCSYVDVREGEVFDAMCKARSFTWFGFCLFARFDRPVPFDSEVIKQ